MKNKLDKAIHIINFHEDADLDPLAVKRKYNRTLDKQLDEDSLLIGVWVNGKEQRYLKRQDIANVITLEIKEI